MKNKFTTSPEVIAILMPILKQTGEVALTQISEHWGQLTAREKAIVLETHFCATVASLKYAKFLCDQVPIPEPIAAWWAELNQPA